MSDDQACEVPLIEQLRGIPNDFRAVRPIQWSEDGRETGHQFIPVGYMMHRAADELAECQEWRHGPNGVKWYTGQLAAMTQSRDEWKHRYGQMDQDRIDAQAFLQDADAILRMLVDAVSADKLEDFTRTSNVADMAEEFLKGNPRPYIPLPPPSAVSETAPSRDAVLEEAANFVEMYDEPRELLPKPTIADLEKMLNSDEPQRIQIRPDGSIWTGPSELMQVLAAAIRALKGAA